jgi:hypothetical protein
MIEFAFLRQRGIELMQQLCGETYTDYNLHDPGVTILEALCYTITDLSYRTGFPIEDLLADRNGKIPLDENALFAREKILSSNPVTVADFRKFILDQMDSLHNVWLEPVISGFSHGTMHGLYTLKIQVKSSLAQQVRSDDDAWVMDLKRQARACFTAGRNLCEDLIRDIKVLRPIPISITAGVVIADHQPESLLANIYRELEAAINPPVKYYAAQELLDRGLRVEDIYAGPLLKKGFIPDEALPPRRRSIDPAELMKVISQVPGVSYVRDLLITTPHGATDKVPFQLAEDECPYFQPDPDSSPIRLLRGKYEIRIRRPVFNDIWPRVQQAARRSLEPMGDPYATTGVPQAHYRDVRSYHSLQHLFPAVYGIGRDGLGAHPPPQRVAAARQLKVYLLFFEQLLANYLAQLANLSRFFSFGDQSAQTYYHQPLYEVPGIRPLLRAFTSEADPEDEQAWEAFTGNAGNGYIQALAEGSETYGTYCERKNAVLDHLLARFNLQPITYPVQLYTRMYGSRDAQTPGSEALEWKAGLLGQLIDLGYNRVRGGDYLRKEGEDKGGFYKLMAALLYIRPPSNDSPPKPLADAVQGSLTFSSAQEDKNDGNDDDKDQDKDAGKDAAAPDVAEQDPHKQEWATIAGAATMLERTPTSIPEIHTLDPETQGEAWNFGRRKTSFFFHGLNAGNYTIGPNTRGGGGWLILFKDPEDTHWQVISHHQEEKGAAASLKALIVRLRRISVLSEGFYIVDHILLRPPVDGNVFGFRFRTSKNELLLQHSRWTSFMERERILSDLLQSVDLAPPLAATPDAGITAWGVKNLGARCRILLQRHKELGFLTDPIDMEDWIWEEAAPDFEHIRQQLILFREKKLRAYPRFEMLVKAKDDHMVREEYYNFNLTIVLPAWPARFQDANFQTFVMDIFKMHAPAHIRLNFQWLNISAMQEFEKIYPHWIAALKEQHDLAPRKQWSNEMVHFLKRGLY